MKKKQLVSLLVMLAVVVGLAVGYVIVKQNNDKRNEVEEEEEDTTIALYEIEQEDIIRIAYSNESTNLAMVLDEDVWLKEGTNIPMKSENVESMLSTISNLVAIRLIQEDVSDLAEFGLDSPILKYCINTVDGTQYELAIGNKLQTGTDGYYAMLNGVPTVYTVSANYYNPFMNTEREMTLIEDEVTINSEYITHLSVESKSGFEFEVDYFGDQLEEDSYYKWNILKPYDNIQADTDSLTTKLADFTNIVYSSCIDYNAEDLEKYGLEDPYATIDIDYYIVTGVEEDSEEDATISEESKEHKNYTLYIGDTLVEGESEYYYVKQEDSNHVYTISASVVNNMIEFSAYAMADPCIYSKLVDQMQGYDIEFGGKIYEVVRKEEPSEEEEDTTVNTYYMNGTKMETTELLQLYSAAYLLTYSGEAETDKIKKDELPVLTITYHLNSGDDVTIQFMPYDGANFYQVDNTGMDYFLTDKRGVDDLISRYEELIQNNNIK